MRGLLKRSRGWIRYGLALFCITTPAVVAMAFGPREWTLLIGLGMLVVFRFLGVIVIFAGVLSMITSLIPRRRRG